MSEKLALNIVHQPAHPRRIMILLPNLQMGGVEQVRMLLAAEFLAAGHQVEFALLEVTGRLLDAVPSGATVTDFACTRLRAVLPRLVRRLRHDPPDVLLAAMWPLSGLAMLANRLAGSPSAVVVSEHTDLRRAAAITGATRWSLKLLGRHLYGTARAIAVSEGVRQSMVELAHLPPSSVAVIHDPIRPPSVAPLPDDELTRWWRSGGAALVAIGSLKPAKAFDLLIDAIGLLRADGGDARLLIIGEGPEHAALQSRIDRHGLADAVRLAGFRADPYPYLHAADLFVLSSRWEGLGNVIIEALACGTNVVATDCPSGPAELLENGRYGRLVTPGDPQALADGIRAALSEPLDPAPMIARAAEFTPARAAAAYLDAMGL